MNDDQKDALTLYFIGGAPVALIIGAYLPRILVLPIAVTLVLGTVVVSNMFRDVGGQQYNHKKDIVIFCSITIVAIWIDVGYHLLTGSQ